MNTEDYIASGILESYVLGHLSLQESKEVEERLANDELLRAEVRKIELSIENLAFASAVEPPAEIQSKLMAKIRTEEKQLSSSTGWMKLAMAASVSLAILTSVVAINYRTRWKDAELRISDLVASSNRIAENSQTVSRELSSLKSAMAVASSADFKRISLKGTPNSPDAIATVYWNPDSRAVFLDARSLKALPNEKQYQLWAIVNGEPVDMGVVKQEEASSLLAKMKTLEKDAAAFAITIEPEGGSRLPSLETMQVIGNV